MNNAPRNLIAHPFPFLRRQHRPVMLIDRILARGGVHVVSAPPFTGKTFFALEAMRSVAFGSPFLGHFPTSHGNVLYLGNDSPAWDLAEQFDKVVGFPDPLEDTEQVLRHTPLGAFGFVFDPNFMLDSKADADAVIATANRQWSTRNYEGNLEDEVYEEVKGSALIVIDTLRSVHGFEEKDDKGMQHVMNLLRYITQETGAAVLALHHPNKSSKDSPQTGLERLRGSTVIPGAVDSVFALTGTAPSIAVRVLKHRPCPSQGDFMYEMAEKNDGMTLSITSVSGVVNVPAQDAILAHLKTATSWTKTNDLHKIVAVVLGKPATDRAVMAATNRCLTLLEKSGMVSRIHGAARLATPTVSKEPQ